MKFQCGGCDKYFKIDNIHVIIEDLNFKCDNCGSDFFINRNLAFSSSSKSSRIICENCGKLINENSRVCDSCNLVLNKTHEELRIDNKDYEPLEINQNGNVYNKNSGKSLKNRSILISGPITIVLILSLASAWYVINNNQTELKNTVLKHLAGIMPKNKNHIETQVVILKSGKTYYADKIEHDGSYIKITNKNGLISEVLEKNVLQISKALIED